MHVCSGVAMPLTFWGFRCFMKVLYHSRAIQLLCSLVRGVEQAHCTQMVLLCCLTMYALRCTRVHC